MIVSAQVSVYPLRLDRLGPAIDMVRAALVSHGLAPQVGPMSSIVVGDHSAVFAALEDAFGKAAGLGHVVMTVSVSNACPIPD
jgi:uncharacterized protein YqgV (UPF0045/DUF77 family)